MTPPRDSERLADRVLAAVRPWVVQLLDESLTVGEEPGGDGLTEAERARSERSWSRFRQRQRGEAKSQPRKEPPPRNAKRPTDKVERSKGQVT